MGRNAIPGQRYIIIDSKVSLKAYQVLLSAKAEEQKLLLKKHTESLAKHIKDLASKEYQKLLSMQKSPDFVLLFCPIEGALAEALRQTAIYLKKVSAAILCLSALVYYLSCSALLNNCGVMKSNAHNVAEVYTQAVKILISYLYFVRT